jgi:hypothetical protein
MSEKHPRGVVAAVVLSRRSLLSLVAALVVMGGGLAVWRAVLRPG